jgi:hypothetical protein
LEKDSGWLERDLHILLGGLGPVQNLLNVGRHDIEFVTVPDCGFQEDSH